MTIDDVTFELMTIDDVTFELMTIDDITFELMTIDRGPIFDASIIDYEQVK